MYLASADRECASLCDAEKNAPGPSFWSDTVKMGLKWFQNGFIIQGLEFVCCESVETQHRGYAEDDYTIVLGVLRAVSITF